MSTRLTLADTIVDILHFTRLARPNPLHDAANTAWKPPLFPVQATPPHGAYADPVRCLAEVNPTSRGFGELPAHVYIVCRSSRRRVCLVDGVAAVIFFNQNTAAPHPSFANFRAGMLRRVGLRIVRDTAMVVTLCVGRVILRRRVLPGRWMLLMVVIMEILRNGRNQMARGEEDSVVGISVDIVVEEMAC